MSTISTSKNLKALQNKATSKDIINRVFENYPEWSNGSYTLPQPISPASLQNVKISAKQTAQVPIDKIAKSVLCGTLLGDTSLDIYKGYANARFQARHSTTQASWFVWKYLVILKNYTNRDAVLYTPPDGFQLFLNNVEKTRTTQNTDAYGKLRITSKVDADLTALHKIVCGKKNGRTVKQIQRKWLNHMNNYFLMTLWLDDGSLYNKRQGVISLEGFPEAQQDVFRNYLQNVWDIETIKQYSEIVAKNGLKKSHCRIHIKDQENLLKLLRLVAPVIPVKEMLYKVCFVPNISKIGNVSLLQRWRTELKGLVRPEFVGWIDNYYDNQP